MSEETEKRHATRTPGMQQRAVKPEHGKRSGGFL
jgi:hypothetical protein